MKKKFPLVLAIVLLMTLALPGSAFAANLSTKGTWTPGAGNCIAQRAQANMDRLSAVLAGIHGSGMYSDSAISGGQGACYNDVDGDGICDNWGIGGCGGYGDADGDGVCDSYSGVGGVCGGACDGYLDADGDGICDNFPNGAGGMHGGGAHGNGVYDSYGNGSGQGSNAGSGAGKHHGGGCSRR